MTLSLTEKNRRVHQRMTERFDRVWGAQKDVRLQCMADRRFYCVAGAQWEGALGEQFANRPQLEMNKVMKAVTRIVSEYRQNRVSARFLARHVGQPAADSAADAASAAYRACERAPLAQEAKDTAFEDAASGGIGAWRLRAAEEDPFDPRNERQRIVIEPIHDADVRVFLDDNCLTADKSAARWGFIITPYTREAYAEAFGDESDPASWTVDTDARQFDWVTQDIVYVAEYYEVVDEPMEVAVWQHLDGAEQRVTARDREAQPGLVRWLRAVGARQVAARSVMTPIVNKYLANGTTVLEGPERIAGQHIPIVVAYGKRQVVDGIERASGAVRVAKDPQRLKNMLTSKLAEIASLGSTEKPILFAEQVAGHTTMWEQDALKNYPYLLINKVTDPVTGQTITGPLSYTKPPTVPAALSALLELAEFDIKDLLGSTEQAEKVVSNVSEQTMSLVQQQIDLQSYIYISNFQAAERRSGQIWLGMARELYVEDGRTLDGLDEGGERKPLRIGQRTIDKRTGSAYVANDFSADELELEVTFGPSSASRRSASVRDLTGMMGVVKDPETLSVLEALALMNLDGEGMGDTRAYFRRKLIALGAIEPTEEERTRMQAEQANKPEDPNSQYLRAAAEKEVAAAIKARADTLLSLARASEAKANAAATMEDVERSNVDQLVNMAAELGAASQSLAAGGEQ